MKPLVLLFTLFACSLLHAAARIHAAHCHATDSTLLLDVDASLALPEEPVNAVKSGLNLHLVFDIDLKAAKRWWEHRPILHYQQRLSYNPISQQFILENPASLKRLSFANLSDALASATRAQALPFILTRPLDPEGDYHASVRLRVDEAQLPVALRLQAFFNPDWHIQSDWFPCPFDR